MTEEWVLELIRSRARYRRRKQGISGSVSYHLAIMDWMKDLRSGSSGRVIIHRVHGRKWSGGYGTVALPRKLYRRQ